MTTETETENRKPGRSWIMWCCVGLIAFALSAAYFIYRTPSEGGAGLSGWLPWLLVALCPLMHFFMHRGHGGGHGGQSRDRDE